MPSDATPPPSLSTPAARRRWGWILGLVALFVLLVYLNNTSRLAEPLGQGPWLVAHRGVSQPFDRSGLTGKTCTAERMLPPQHAYLENSLASMEAAFEYGATVVEVDVQRTADDRFAVFHDWTVECRTEGEGRTRDHTLAALQALDIGYGYTADGGESYPFRGQGVGLLPSLDAVFAAFPERRFVLDVKSGAPEDGQLLAEGLARLPEARRAGIVVHGGPKVVEAIRQRFPTMVTSARPRLKRCLLRYITLGWTGHVPAVCERALIAVPADIAPWLWGWPNRFLRRMDSVGSPVVLLGAYEGGGLSQGFDDPEQLKALPQDYSGGIWTDRIELLGPLVQESAGER